MVAGAYGAATQGSYDMLGDREGERGQGDDSILSVMDLLG